MNFQYLSVGAMTMQLCRPRSDDHEGVRAQACRSTHRALEDVVKESLRALSRITILKRSSIVKDFRSSVPPSAKFRLLASPISGGELFSEEAVSSAVQESSACNSSFIESATLSVLKGARSPSSRPASASRGRLFRGNYSRAPFSSRGNRTAQSPGRRPRSRPRGQSRSSSQNFRN